MGFDDFLDASSGRQWTAPFLATLLEDPYPAVRFIARRSLGQQPGFDRFEFEVMAPPEKRAAAALAAKERWRRARRAADKPDEPTYLLDKARGDPEPNVFERLYAQRDNRVVNLAE